MKAKNNDFQEIEILKERYRLRILEQELKIKSTARELGENITGAAMVRRLQDKLFSGSGLAFKLGFMAVSLIRERIRNKHRK